MTTIAPRVPSGTVVTPYRLNSQYAGHFYYIEDACNLELAFIASGGGTEWTASEGDVDQVAEKKAVLDALLSGGTAGEIEILEDQATVTVRKGLIERLEATLEMEVDVEGKTDEEIKEERISLADKKRAFEAQAKADENKEVVITRHIWKVGVQFPTQALMVAFLAELEKPSFYANLALPEGFTTNVGEEGFLICRASSVVFHSSLLEEHVSSATFLRAATKKEGLKTVTQMQSIAAAFLTRLDVAKVVAEQDESGVVYDSLRAPRFFRISRAAEPDMAEEEGSFVPHTTVRMVLFPFPGLYRYSSVPSSTQSAAGAAVSDNYTTNELTARIRDMLQLDETQLKIDVLSTFYRHPSVHPINQKGSAHKNTAILRLSVASEEILNAIHLRAKTASQYLSSVTPAFHLFQDEVWYDPILGRVVDSIPEGGADLPMRQGIESSEIVSQLDVIMKCTASVSGLFARPVEITLESARTTTYGPTLEGSMIFPHENPLKRLQAASNPSDLLLKKLRSDFDEYAQSQTLFLARKAKVEKYEMSTLLAALFRLRDAGNFEKIYMKETYSKTGTTVTLELDGAMKATLEGAKSEVGITTCTVLLEALEKFGDVGTPLPVDITQGQSNLRDMLHEARSGGKRESVAASPVSVQREQQTQRKAADRVSKEEEERVAPRKVPPPRRETPENQFYNSVSQKLKSLTQVTIEELQKEGTALLDAGGSADVLGALEKRIRDPSVPTNACLGAWYLLDSLMKVATHKHKGFLDLTMRRLVSLSAFLPCKKDRSYNAKCAKLVATWKGLVPEDILVRVEEQTR